MPNEEQAQALTEARRVLDSQTKRYDDLRGRAISLLAAGAVVAGLFSVHMNRRQDTLRLWFEIAAVVAFAGLALLVIMVNAPGDWDDGPKVGEVLDNIRDRGDLSNFDYQLARAINTTAEKNECHVMALRTGLFTVACGVLTLEVLCWAVAALL
jgi:hypothetical protein